MKEGDGVVDAVDLHRPSQGTVYYCDKVREGGDFIRRCTQVAFHVVKDGLHIGVDRDEKVDDRVAMEKDTATEEIAEGKETGGLPDFFGGCEGKL